MTAWVLSAGDSFSLPNLVTSRHGSLTVRVTRSTHSMTTPFLSL